MGNAAVKEMINAGINGEVRLGVSGCPRNGEGGHKKNPDDAASVRSANPNDAVAAIKSEKVADLEEEDEEKEVTESVPTVDSCDVIGAS